MAGEKLIINEDYETKGVRWKVGNRTLDEVVATILDMPPERPKSTNMIHSWRNHWRTKNPNPANRSANIGKTQTESDLKAGEAVGAFKRVGEGSSTVWVLVPEVLGLG
jgi:hypothetical protein